ncbi:MAG: DUF3488 domain-containing protein, partial [Propionibacteriaceae bacterium]|nr:DUF3488 domain-containing protein [Propionibacteriaceae bacterium]
MRRAGLALVTWVACTATFMGVSNLVVAGAWLVQLAVLTFLITLVTWAITSLIGTKHPVWAALSAEVVSLAIWVGHLCAVAGGGAGVMRVVPTSEALHNVVARVTQAIAALSDYGRPALNVELFLPLVLVGLGPICLLTVCLALVMRSPVWIGAPLALCWALFMAGAPTGSVGWAMASVVAYLLVVALADKPGRWSGRLRVRGVAVVVLATIMGGAATVIAPTMPGWGGGQTWITDWGKPYVDSTGISMDGPVNIGDSLRQQSDEVLFRTTGDLPGPLKLGSMSVFDGANWSASSDGWAGTYDNGDIIGGLDPRPVTNGDGSVGWTSRVSSAWSQASLVTV